MGPAGSIYDGKTLDEAVRKGLDELGLSRAEVSITVVAEGSGGFLGFGARPFKVRVTPRPGGAIREAAVREDDDRRSRDRGGRDRGGRGGRGGERGGRDRGGRGGDRGRDRGRGGRTDEPRRDQPVAAAGREAGGDRAPRGDREPRGDRGDRAPRGDREPRGDRGDRAPRTDREVTGDRAPRTDREVTGDRAPRTDREVMGDRAPRTDREVMGDRAPRGDREAGADRGDRAPRGDREPRGDRNDRGGRPDRGPRGGRDDREERRRSNEPRIGEERRVAADNGRAGLESRPAEGDQDLRVTPPAGDDRPDEREGRGGRRRRRGRRGGMGRGTGTGTGEGAVMTMPPADDGMQGEDTGVPAVNLADTNEGYAATEPVAARPSRGEGDRGRRSEAAEGGAPLLTGDALAAEGKRWTEQMLTAMGFEATLRATTDGDRVTVVATIADGENLIAGERDEVRQAMQQILNRMINRGEGSRYHLQLEINDFWEKRETDLKALALRLAAEALEGNTEVMTDYLNSQERRIIHVTLREDTRVKTWSVGVGHIKRLAVAPADFPGGPVDES